MDISQYRIQNSTTDIHFKIDWERCKALYPPGSAIVLTDYHVYLHHHKGFSDYPTIKIPAGEGKKSLESLRLITTSLMESQADRHSTLICVGGGVITDLGGLAASVYKRGMKLVHVPSSLLAMVDAALGGKNAVNLGDVKNILGTTYQPEAVLIMPELLESLPVPEWRQGFAEIIKHACIRDAPLFDELRQNDLHTYSNDPEKLRNLIRRNIDIKMQVVEQDPEDKHERKLLNFGHSIGHALEKRMGIPHGDAVSIGMVAAANLSVRLGFLTAGEAAGIIELLHRYQLPVDAEVDIESIAGLIRQDKKRQGSDIDFILLQAVGKAFVHRMSIAELDTHLPFMFS